MSGTGERAPSAWLVVTSLGLTIGHLVSRLPMLTARRFDPDEFEHAHVAWYLLQGHVPYRDFFEHHTPLYHYLLAGLLASFDVGRSADQAFAGLFAARYAGWATSVMILVAVFVLARRIMDATVAWVGLPIAAGSVVMALRAVEIRPDGLSTVLWLGSLVALHAAMSTGQPGSWAARARFGGAGVLIGLAVLTSQKLLLAGPVLLLVLLWYVTNPRFGAAVRERSMDAAWQAGGVLVVWLAAIGFFAAQGAAADFLRRTVIEGVGWKAETSPGTVLAFIAQYDPWIFALSAGGTVLVLRQIVRAGATPPTSSVVLLGAAGGMFGGLFIVPVPYAQYCLTFLPLFAILAAVFVVSVVRALASTGVSACPRDGGWMAAAVLVFLAVSWASLTVARPVVVTQVVYPLLVAGALLVVVATAVHGRPAMSFSVALVALSIVPAQSARWMAELGDRGQFAGLRYVMDHTARDAVVLDGWTGYGVFRQHASYYWMLHPGVHAMLPSTDRDRLVEGVVSGRVQPDVVVLDEQLRALSPRLLSFVEREYVSAGIDGIYLRR